tara:strand:+ start:589 stop:1032 length:444 start_codon:yes stop_codon:yes gene_type:complete
VPHVRQSLRERIASNVTGLTTTGANVFQSRVYTLEPDDLPCLLVYSTSETSERATMATTDSLNRDLTVMVEGYARTASNLDDTLDTISAEVETAVASDPTCNALALDTFLQSTEIEYDAEGDQPIGSVRLSFSVHYQTKTTVPTTAL